MNTTGLGRQAEESAATYLRGQNYKILSKNWRSRWCEIDIVARKDKTVYFVEVKYRLQNTQGEPVEFVTGKKLKQMEFAAKFWANSNDWDGDMRLAVASVGGEDFKLEDFILLD